MSSLVAAEICKTQQAKASKGKSVQYLDCTVGCGVRPVSAVAPVVEGVGNEGQSSLTVPSVAFGSDAGTRPLEVSRGNGTEEDLGSSLAVSSAAGGVRLPGRMNCKGFLKEGVWCIVLPRLAASISQSRRPSKCVRMWRLCREHVGRG